MTRVSILVCTRNRPNQIVKAVQSLLRDDHVDDALELIVLDQSTGSDTQAVLAAHVHDPRLRYRRTRSIGKGVGLNEGLQLASGETIVITDDDCEVPPGWARNMASLFDARPRVAVAFCNVVPVPHDRGAGYVPSYERHRSRLVRSIGALGRGLGLGAGMAIRKHVALDLGGFDELFGPGGRFPSGDEWDFAIRALARGWHVYETHEIAIVHDGFRSFADGREHTRRDWIALGAVSAKALRIARLPAALGPLCFYPRSALLPPLSDLLNLRRPRGLIRITAFLRGFADGMRWPLDPQTFRFRPPAAIRCDSVDDRARV